MGVSIYTNKELLYMINHKDVEVIQLPFNLLDNNSQRKKLLIQAKYNNKIIHVRSVFLQGLFFMNEDLIPTKIKALQPFLNLLKKIADDCELNINTLALNYVLQQNHIDKIIIGVETKNQLISNFQLVHLNSETIKRIDSIKIKDPELLYPINWT